MVEKSKMKQEDEKAIVNKIQLTESDVTIAFGTMENERPLKKHVDKKEASFLEIEDFSEMQKRGEIEQIPVESKIDQVDEVVIPEQKNTFDPDTDYIKRNVY